MEVVLAIPIYGYRVLQVATVLVGARGEKV